MIDLTEDGTGEEITMKGPGWFTMQYAGDKPSKISISPNITSDIYIIKDSAGDPNDFVYDMKFMGVTGNMTFNSDDLAMTSSKGYSIAVYTNAVDEAANELLNGKIDLFFSIGASTFGIVSGLVASVLAFTL